MFNDFLKEVFLCERKEGFEIFDSGDVGKITNKKTVIN
jgi:hypothetical protein